MKIFYEQVKDEGYAVDTAFEFIEDSDKFQVKSFNGRVDKSGDVYLLTGLLDLSFECPCDRCLEPVLINIKEDLKLVLSPVGEYPKMKNSDDEGLTDEEVGMYATPYDHFDLHELIREESVLAVPEKRLCRPDCKGICPDCGASLNTEKCSCVAKTDPRWQSLAKLKGKPSH